jgi:hypothetical protein
MRVEVRGRGVDRVKGKVCFGFLLLDDPCPSDYARGQRNFLRIWKLHAKKVDMKD